MNKYERRNNTVIDRAFNEFCSAVRGTTLDGLEKLCENAIKTIIGEHKPEYQHMQAKDAYAYAIYYDGAIVSAKSFSPGNEYQEIAPEVALNYSPEPTGWDAVIVAGMSKDFYRLEMERRFMTEAQQDIEENFLSYFNLIQVK